jgi:hypothetical protein
MTCSRLEFGFVYYIERNQTRALEHAGRWYNSETAGREMENVRQGMYFSLKINTIFFL